MAHLGKALDAVRKAEYARLSGTDRSVSFAVALRRFHRYIAATDEAQWGSLACCGTRLDRMRMWKTVAQCAYGSSHHLPWLTVQAVVGDPFRCCPETKMYTENPAEDVLRFTRAMLTNQLARFTPQLYLKLTQQTGRGDGKADPSRTADYFLRCFDDYREQLGLDRDQIRDFLRGKLLLEYGPGDVLGVALLMYANGAEFVQCVDRFPLERVTPKNIRTYMELMDRLEPEQRERAKSAFNDFGKPESGFDPRLVSYSVTHDGLIDKQDAYDLIISRSVLEHVNLLDMTISDMAKALRADGIAVHKVDLKSHGLDRYRSFDFLTWPESIYQLMNSHKGSPNRWRVDKYKELVDRHGLRFRALAHTGQLEPEKINRIRPKLASSFRDVPSDELSWLGFWMVLERAWTDPAGRELHKTPAPVMASRH